MSQRMRLLAIAFLVTVAAISGRAIADEWEQFKAHHKKTYPSAADESYRRTVFLENLKQIRKHNLEADLKLHTWYMGISHLSDMTDEEITRTMTGYRQPIQDSSYKPHDVSEEDGYEAFETPVSIDWRQRGYVNKVVDQGLCGSCYTFSAAVALEGQYMRNKGQLVKFSEQNLIDCSYGKWYSYQYSSNNGCNGGWMNNCFNATKEMGGLETEDDYPYEARLERCRIDNSKKKSFTVSHSRNVNDQTESSMKKAIGKVGPLSVAISTQGYGFSSYRSGVYNPRSCPTAQDHAVAVVGYGREDDLDYWIVRNSWSETWGDSGYIKMIRNQNCMCGICKEATYPVFKQ